MKERCVIWISTTRQLVSVAIPYLYSINSLTDIRPVLWHLVSMVMMPAACCGQCYIYFYWKRPCSQSVRFKYSMVLEDRWYIFCVRGVYSLLIETRPLCWPNYIVTQSPHRSLLAALNQMCLGGQWPTDTGGHMSKWNRYVKGWSELTQILSLLPDINIMFSKVALPLPS